jgi:hypothetical protein
VQQVFGLVAELVQVGPGRHVWHDVSLTTPWSAAGPEEIVIMAACYLTTEVDSVLPADPAAPSGTGHGFYRAVSRCVVWRSAGFAEVGEQGADAASDAVVAFDLAVPAAC